MSTPPLARRLLFVALLAGIATAQEAIPKAILEASFAPSAEDIMEHVRTFAAASMRGRLSGSKEAARAAELIGQEFKRLGLKPAGDDGGFEQAFERATAVAIKSETAGGKTDGGKSFKIQKAQCRNVLAWFPGSDEKRKDEFLLVGAHFDHLGVRGDKVFYGADDNASGIAGMLAVARACVKGEKKLRRSVLFAAFGAEEQGLRGSQHFARHPPRSLQQLVAMINLDMIGRPRLLDKKQFGWAKKLVGIPDSRAVGVLGVEKSPELGHIARGIFAADKLPLFAPEDFGMLKPAIQKMAEGRSDHAPFEQRRIPFLFFSTSEHDDYHQPTDTVDKVDGETIHRIARCVYRTVLAIDARDERPRFVEPKKAVERKKAVDSAKTGKPEKAVGGDAKK